jgi:hypothetical protein
MSITISGNGIVEANLADNAVTLAKMASGTDGEILTYDASGNPVAVSVGTDGQVLTSTGAGSPPAFETAAAGGKVLQVVSGSISSTLSTSSTSFADMSASLSKSMTLSSSSNKVLVFVGINGGYRSSGSGATSPEFIITDSSNVTISTMSGMSYHTLGAGYSSGTQVAFTYLWSPGITSITVKCRWKSPSGDSYKVNENSHGGTPSTSTITLMEIGA